MSAIRLLSTSSVIATAAALIAIVGCRERVAETKRAENEPVDARVSIRLGGPEEKYVEVLLTDKMEVRRLVADPIQQAKPDPNPKDYVFIGTMDIHNSDGSQKGVTLFLPWGHYKIGDKYMIGDFDALRATVLGSLERAEKIVTR